MDILAGELLEILDKNDYGEVEQKYRRRILEGNLTREENSQSHFCVCFLPYDPKSKKIFIGFHRKSGKWLCNGGHIEMGHSLHQAVAKEIREELGLKFEELDQSPPALLTTTLIENTLKDGCRLHFDVWFFKETNPKQFKPNPEAMATEFYAAEWMDLDEARRLNVSKSMTVAFDFIERKYF